MNLGGKINQEFCESYPFSQKLELKLAKSVQNVNWNSLTPGSGFVNSAKQVSNVIEAPKEAKPYASKKNWDKIDQELKADLD